MVARTPKVWPTTATREVRKKKKKRETKTSPEKDKR